MHKFILKHYKNLWRFGFIIQWLGAISSLVLYFLNGWWSVVAFAICLSGYLLTVICRGIVRQSFIDTLKKDALFGLFGKARRRSKRKLDRKYGKITDLVE